MEQHGISPGMQASHHEGGAFRLTDNDDLCLFILVLLDGRTLLLDVGVPHGRETSCTPAFDGFQSLRNKLLRCQVEDILHSRHCFSILTSLCLLGAQPYEGRDTTVRIRT